MIEVVAAGVNKPDCFQRQGHYPPPPGESDVPGLEVAGRIVGVGEGVAKSRLGENVCALVGSGAMPNMPSPTHGFACRCRAA